MIRLPELVEVYAPTTGVRDRNGNLIVTWPGTPTAIEPALMRPLSSDEATVSGDTLIVRWKVLLHSKTVTNDRSRIKHLGKTYEVDGEVQAITDRRGRIDHREAFLKAVT